MEIQKQILLFFASLHGPALNFLAQFFTIFAEEYALIAFGVFIFWNIDKKKGFSSCFSLLIANNAMNIIKAIVRFPRPWMLIDGLDTVRQGTATGYSFPSGHTTSAASFYSAVAVNFRKRWLSIICAVMIFFAALSRMFLCVHWPMDVGCGLLLGCGCTFVLLRWMNSVYDDKQKCIKVSMWIGIIFTLAFIVISILLMTGSVDELAFGDLNVSVSLFGGLGFGFALERSRFDYQVEKGNWGKKILRYVIGMAVIFFLMMGVKPILVSLNAYNALTRCCRYFLVGFWGGVYPIVGRKLKLFS
ncbi:MAG TPA: phosphoesterase PA-phosphatase [Sphaerochaeta sp.]|nr:phosphoesterase PA-phosphatase [Sphaerochaeta sp.]